MIPEVRIIGTREIAKNQSFPWRAFLLAIPIVALSVGVASAETVKPSASEGVFLLQIVLLLVCGRLLGEGMQRIGQPAVMGQLIAGILLGPSVFGMVWPAAQQAIFPVGGAQQSMIDAISQLGILMLLLLTGMETDLAVVRQSKAAAFSVSVSGIVVPFACGVALGELMPAEMLPDPGRRLITALFLGTALSISSVKIVAMVVRDVGFMRRLVGQVIVASAIVDDTIGWIIMAITFGLAEHGSIDVASVSQSVIGTALFLIASFTLGPRVVFLMIRWSNDNFVTEVPVITTILVVMGLMALLTQAIGVHTVLGAFVAGILVGQSPILTKHIDEQLRGLIVALFMPVFFGLAGQHTDLSVLADTSMLTLAAGMIVIASVGKFSGAFMGGKIGGMTWRESLALGCGMNARGSTEVIVATLGMTMGVIGKELFTSIMIMAIVTTMAMPPMLRWALSLVPMRPDEKERLDREAAEAASFVSNLERMLVVVDRSASGRRASRLAGSLAASGRIVTTVIPVDDMIAENTSHTDETAEPEAIIKAAGERATAASTDSSKHPLQLDVETRHQNRPVEDVVPEQAKQGHDFLMIGVEPAMEDDYFSERVTRVAQGFDGPLAIVVSSSGHRDDPDRSESSILVPVSGTPHSRRGAEVALALGRANGATITAIYTGGEFREPASGRNAEADRDEDAILSEIVRLGEQMGVAVKTVPRRNTPSAEAVLYQMKIRAYDLVVLGVTPMPGDTLSFGNVAGTILRRADRTVMLVSG